MRVVYGSTISTDEVKAETVAEPVIVSRLDADPGGLPPMRTEDRVTDEPER